MTDGNKSYYVSKDAAHGEVFKKLMSACGVETELFSDAKTFLQKLKAFPPNFCVIDVNVEIRKDGLLLAKAVRHAFGPTYPLFIVLEPSDRRLAKAVQEIHCHPLLRPLEPAPLKPMIDAAIAMSKKTPARPLVQSPHPAAAPEATPEPSVAPATAPTPVAAQEAAPAAPAAASEPKVAKPEQDLPPLLKQFFAEIVPLITELGQSCESLDTQEKRLKFYWNALDPYSEPFMKFFKAGKTIEPGTRLDAAIRLFGINQTRDLLLAIRLSELVHPEKGFQWDPQTSKPKIPASQIVSYAHKTLLEFGEDSRYKHVAYSSGLVFDALIAIAGKSPTTKTKIQSIVEQLHSQSVKTAKATYGLITGGSGVALELFIVVTCLMRNAGKLALAILDPSYVELLRLYESKKVPPLFQFVLEEEKYQLHHAMLGAVLCQCLPIQSKAALSTLCVEAPLFLQDSENKPRFDLASICQRGYFRVFPPEQPAAEGKPKAKP